MKKLEVVDVASFVKYIADIGEQLNNSRWILNGSLLFRGQCNCDFELLPSIARNYKGQKSPLLCKERELVESVMMHLPHIFEHSFEPIELLALLQHYGVPTRLLDVTENALVALFFACCEEFQKDGEVIVFCQNENNTRVRTLVNAIADTYRFANSETTYLNSFYGSVIYQPYYLEQKYIIEDSRTTPNDGAVYLKHYAVSPIFTYAQIHSPRQQVQAGRYLIFPNNISVQDGLLAFDREITPIPKDHDCIVGYITVKQEAKQSILKTLRLLGITEKSLFPDNTDIVCKGIVNSFI